MKLGFNFVNSVIILLLLILFLLFKYVEESFMGSMIIIISLISGCSFVYLERNKNAIVCFYIMLLFSFYWISKSFNDNFSMKALIDKFKFKENDILNYKLLVSTRGDLNKCKITGKYDKKNLEITNNFSDEKLCEEIKKNIGNKFISGVNTITSSDSSSDSGDSDTIIVSVISIIISILLIFFVMNPTKLSSSTLQMVSEINLNAATPNI